MQDGTHPHGQRFCWHVFQAAEKAFIGFTGFWLQSHFMGKAGQFNIRLIKANMPVMTNTQNLPLTWLELLKMPLPKVKNYWQKLSNFKTNLPCI